jgi:hypothetical protein
MAQDELVDALASKAMGIEPQAPATPPVTAAPSAEAQDKDTPTEAEIAIASASPADETDAMDAPAMTFKIGERNLTEKQIASTMDRYKALNYQNAQYKPVMEVIRQLEAKYQTTPDQLAKAILEISESPNVAQASAAAVGATPENTQPEAIDQQDVFRQWEEENSASLPPGYKDINGTMASLAAMNAETQNMLRAVLAHSDGAVKAAAQANERSQEQNSVNMQRQLSNNLDRVQQHFSMSDEQAQDFVNFAEDRGYTMEDFLDGQLLVNVVRDFKNLGSEGELVQLRAQRERRQAFSGSIGSSPGTESAAQRSAEPEGATDLDRIAQQIMSSRNRPV